MTEYLRMSGLYWGVASLALMDKIDSLSRKEVIDFVKECQCSETGGFCASQKHDPHLLYTLSAIQVRFFNNYINSIKILIFNFQFLNIFPIFKFYSILYNCNMDFLKFMGKKLFCEYIHTYLHKIG